MTDSNVPLTIRYKPRISGEENYYQSRKVIEAERSQIFNNPFENYISSFSEDFPQKEMMTIDLIEAIKKEKEREKGLKRGTSYE